MICGALQTLNEEAFEDVVGSERPSPTGGPSGETLIQHQLPSINEGPEFGSPPENEPFSNQLLLQMRLDNYIQNKNNNNSKNGAGDTTILIPGYQSYDDTPL